MRVRLTLWAVVAVALIVLAGSALTYVLLGRELTDHLGEDLLAEADQYAESLPPIADADDLVSFTSDYLTGAQLASLRERGVVFSLVLPGSRALSTSDVAFEEYAFADEVLSGAEVGPRTLETAEGGYLVYGRPVQFEDGPVVAGAVVAAPLAPVEVTQQRLLPVLLIGGLIGVLVLGAGSWFLIGRALVPVRQMTETAGEISRRDLSRRIEYRGPDDEVAGLARTLNLMLARLEQAFSAQERFIADVSHELRTPLTIMKGHIQLLQEEERPDWPQVQREHDLVLDQLDRLNRLVEELLSLARLERGDILEWTELDLDEFVGTLVEHGRYLADRDWELDRAPGGRVEGDKDRLTQAMLNLMQNAVRHTEPGQRVGLGARLDGDQYRLWVRDEGAGMPADVAARVMERFYRGSDGDEGLGLGLAIVKGIAEAHGGRVEVESAVGEGSRFTLVLPRYTAARAHRRPAGVEDGI